MRKFLILGVALLGMSVAGTVKADEYDHALVERMITAMERMEARLARLEERDSSYTPSYSTPASYIRPASYTRTVEPSYCRSSYGSSYSDDLDGYRGSFRYEGYTIHFYIVRD